MKQKKSPLSQSPLFIIFTTVFLDLLGFGMVIPLVGVYGKHYGATVFELSMLGAIYSLMQFIFAPFWGALSDRFGRRPILLISLLGQCLSYILFGFAPSYLLLFLSRMFAGIFAANISTAFAFIADVTTSENRAKGMGLMGVAFGLGFMFGPPLGGISAKMWGLSAPGLIAATICGLNWILALFRLPESLPINLRKSELHSFKIVSPEKWAFLKSNATLLFFLLTFFFVTFAFSTMEQTFSLLFQSRFFSDTAEAGYKTGLVLLVSGLAGIVVQGGLIRRLVPKYGERNLLLVGLLINGLAMAIFPFGPSYESYFIICAILSLGSGFVNPCISSLISKSVSSADQGKVFGLTQGFGSLARALGPFFGLMAFGWNVALPYLSAAVISFVLWAVLKNRKIELAEVK